MNIFVIPSWYPTKTVPLSGIFVKEQVIAIAECFHDCNLIVAKWDNGYAHLSPKRPFLGLKSITSFIKSTEEDIRVGDNIYEFYTPTLFWSNKLPFGGATRLYRSIKSSLLRAKKIFGKIDILHAHVSYPAGFIAYQLSKEFDIPYVLTEHMGPFPFKSFQKNGLPIKEIQLAFNHAKRTIAVSTSLKHAITSFHLPCSDVVSNMIDDSHFMLSNHKKKKFTFFTLCTLSPEKGIDTLLKAISLLDHELKDRIDFVIGGGGKYLAKYKKMMKKLDLHNVTFVGEISRKDVPSFFQSSHAYIMLSRHESFGMVYAEAIASGLPVITTKCGGPEDIINHTNGIFIEIDNPQETVLAIHYVYKNYSKYPSEDIRKDFENRFGKTAIANKIMRIYNEVLLTCAD